MSSKATKETRVAGVGCGRGSTGGDRSRKSDHRGPAGWVRAWTFVLNEIGNLQKGFGKRCDLIQF